MTAQELIDQLAKCEPTAQVRLALPLAEGFETLATITSAELHYSSPHETEAPRPDRIALRFD